MAFRSPAPSRAVESVVPCRQAYQQRVHPANRWAALAGAPLMVWQDQARSRPALAPENLTIRADNDQRVPGAHPLHDAIDRLDARRVADLLEQGADPNDPASRSTTTWAARTLYAHDPLWATKNAITPLHEALLMVPVNPPGHPWPAYQNAWTLAELDAQAMIVGLLLAAGASVDEPIVMAALQQPNPALTALVLGCWNDRSPPSAVRLNHLGVRMASDEWDVLFPKDLWRHLLNAGWCLTMANAGQTPLDAALHRGRSEMVHALLDLGAPLTPTALAQGVRRHGQDGTVIRRLIQAGGDVNATDSLELGLSILHIAAVNDQVPALWALIDAGAAVNVQDAMGRTPLYLAAERGNADSLEALLAAGADPTVQAQRKVALVDVARARLNQPDTDGDDRRTVQVLEDLALRAVLGYSD